MRKTVLTVIPQLFKVLFFPQIKIQDRIIFVLTYPIAVIGAILSNKYHKTVPFIDRTGFIFLGKHYNLALNHLIDHLNYYYPLYAEGGVIVDIGASFGTFPRTVNYFAPNSQVFAVEMVRESYDILVKNCGQIPNVFLFNSAIDQKRGRAEYTYDRDFPEGGNLGLVNYSQTGSVSKVTLDDLLTQNKIKKITVLKIDAEGHELKILKSASKSLQLTKWAIVETQFDTKNILAVLKIMAQHGFYLDRFGAVNYTDSGSIGSADLIFKRGLHHI